MVKIIIKNPETSLEVEIKTYQIENTILKNRIERGAKLILYLYCEVVDLYKIKENLN